MKKIFICLGILILVYQYSYSQKTRVSLIARGNYMFERGDFSIGKAPFDDLDVSPLVTTFTRSPENKSLKGFGGGEVGIDLHYLIEEDLELVFGAHLLLYQFRLTRTAENARAIRVQGFFSSESILPRSTYENKSIKSISYLKIPLFLNYRFEEDFLKLHVHAGLSLDIQSLSWEKVTKAPESLIAEEVLLIAPDTLFIPTAPMPIKTRKEFNPLMFGFDVGLVYYPWINNPLGIEVNFYRSLNRFIVEEGFAKINLNAFSLGVRWNL